MNFKVFVIMGLRGKRLKHINVAAKEEIREFYSWQINCWKMTFI